MVGDPELRALYAANCRRPFGSPSTELLQGAWERVVDMAERWPDEAWDLVLLLLAEVDDEWSVINVGVGVLEDLMSTHAVRFIDRLEAAVHREPRVAKAVSSMWIEGAPIELRFRALRAQASSMSLADAS